MRRGVHRGIRPQKRYVKSLTSRYGFSTGPTRAEGGASRNRGRQPPDRQPYRRPGGRCGAGAGVPLARQAGCRAPASRWNHRWVSPSAKKPSGRFGDVRGIGAEGVRRQLLREGTAVAWCSVERRLPAPPAVLHMSRVPHPGREPLSLRPERTCVGGAAFDPSGQLTFRPKVLSIDPQPPLHQLATHLRQASVRLRDEPG